MAAISIALQLAQALGKWLGGKIIAELFPSKTPNYFTEEVYIKITEIVRNEVQEQFIATFQATADAILSWFRIEYLPQSEGEAVDYQGLLDDLDDRQSKLSTDAVFPLMTQSFCKPGFTVFMLAANLHLAFLQEMKRIAYLISQEKGAQRAFAVAEYARLYVGSADTRQDRPGTYKQIWLDRQALVTIDTRLSPGGTPQAARWYDQLENKYGEWYKDHYDPEEIMKHVSADRSHYIETQLRPVFERLLDYESIKQILDEWKKLAR